MSSGNANGWKDRSQTEAERGQRSTHIEASRNREIDSCLTHTHTDTHTLTKEQTSGHKEKPPDGQTSVSFRPCRSSCLVPVLSCFCCCSAARRTNEVSVLPCVAVNVSFSLSQVRRRQSLAICNARKTGTDKATEGTRVWKSRPVESPVMKTRLGLFTIKFTSGRGTERVDGEPAAPGR